MPECAPGPLPKINTERREPPVVPEETEPIEEEPCPTPVQKVFFFWEPTGCLKEREDFSLYIFPLDHP